MFQQQGLCRGYIRGEAFFCSWLWAIAEQNHSDILGAGIKGPPCIPEYTTRVWRIRFSGPSEQDRPQGAECD